MTQFGAEVKKNDVESCGAEAERPNGLTQFDIEVKKNDVESCGAEAEKPNDLTRHVTHVVTQLVPNTERRLRESGS